MRLTPAQIAVRLICGQDVPPHESSLRDRIKEGRDFLVSITGRDFGYDLRAWHEHLKKSRQGGYTYGRNVELPRMMKIALQSEEWQSAVRDLNSR